MRRVLGGDKPADLPSRIDESRLHGMKSIKQDTFVIGRAPGPLSLPLAPVMALRPIRPWSVAPHGRLSHLQADGQLGAVISAISLKRHDLQLTEPKALPITQLWRTLPADGGTFLLG